MKRWRVWFLLTLLACLPILLGRGSGAGLLADTDTAALLSAIEQRHAPMSWFITDWPLENHFYRPLPTLTFELDHFWFSKAPDGYGWSNATICALCVLALFWFLREVTDSPVAAFGGSALFVIWTRDWGIHLSPLAYWSALGLVVLGFLRHGLKGSRYLPATLVLVFLGTQLQGEQALAYRMIGWLPGRTASVMTLFALLGMAAYARYERLSGVPKLAPATALDPPEATRTSEVLRRGRVGGWLAISIAGLLGALCSYEQAVMVPACLLALAVYFRLRGYRPNWTAHVLFWLLLLGYVAFRRVIIPSGASNYQSQQFRHGPQVFIDILDYALPNIAGLLVVWNSLTVGWLAVVTPNVSSALGTAIGTIATFFASRRHWVIVLSGLVLSTLAYLPMAWLKFFAHYHYWPMALRTVFVIGIVRVAWDLASIAVCPPAMQAPERLSPAPGSLPHR